MRQPLAWKTGSEAVDEEGGSEAGGLSVAGVFWTSDSSGVVYVLHNRCCRPSFTSMHAPSTMHIKGCIEWIAVLAFAVQLCQGTSWPHMEPASGNPKGLPGTVACISCNSFACRVQVINPLLAMLLVCQQRLTPESTRNPASPLWSSPDRGLKCFGP